jgi:DivIVA domain-containing protein
VFATRALASIPPMPSSETISSAIDSLQTVEFRQTIRGYHVDDVDEYLEQVAKEVEALREQLRQSGERMRQATDRIVQLEAQQREGTSGTGTGAAADDESLQRTLLMAQKFVEQTEAETRAQSSAAIEEAQERARTLVADAEERARAMSNDAEKRLREEVDRLEGTRSKLAGEVETISRHLDSERSRLRSALGEMLHWIDEHLQPAVAKPHDLGIDERQDQDDHRQGEMPMGSGTPRSGLQTVAQANAPNGSPR